MVRPCVASGFRRAGGERSCINVSGFDWSFALLAIMDISAPAISLAGKGLKGPRERISGLSRCAAVRRFWREVRDYWRFQRRKTPAEKVGRGRSGGGRGTVFQQPLNLQLKKVVRKRHRNRTLPLQSQRKFAVRKFESRSPSGRPSNPPDTVHSHVTLLNLHHSILR
jgi:hypothetical protein